MIENLLIFAFSLFLIIRGATLATDYSAKLAYSYNFSKYVVGFIIVSFISILPEAFIAINSAIKGMPEFGLGTLFGSNIADLTLVFALLILFANRGLKIESKILKNIHLYPFFILIPLIFGSNGHYSRVEGIALILAGGLFYYLIFREGIEKSQIIRGSAYSRAKYIFLFLLSMAMLLIGSNYVVISATAFASELSISPILIAMLIVGLGSTIPELFYSAKSIEKNDDGLAIGDILGTVLADATIIVGVLSLISPFYFPVKIVYVTGAFMLIACLVLLKFMRSGRYLSKREGALLSLFWLIYVIVELVLTK